MKMEMAVRDEFKKDVGNKGRNRGKEEKVGGEGREEEAIRRRVAKAEE